VRHLSRHSNAPALLATSPPCSSGAVAAVCGALLASLRFVGSPYRLLPFLLHSLGGCAVGATMLGTPRVAAAALSGSYFLGRIVAHVDYTAGTRPTARRAPLESLVTRLPQAMRRWQPGPRAQASLADLPRPGSVDLVGAAA